MKAWQFTTTHEPLREVELADPTPGAGQVVIDVKAAGICHSDVGIFEDEKWLDMMTPPIVPGHESAGVIVATGEGVTDFEVGDRVAVWPMEGHGYTQNGGFGEKVLAATDVLVRIPDNVSFELAAAATDAGMTSHGAVMGTGQVTAGDRVGIIGFGGLGQIGARVAVLNGAEVYVAEVNEEIWPRIIEAGAQAVAKDISEFADKDLSVIVDFAGFGATTAHALETVGFGGRVVQVGMGRLEATINTYPLITKRLQLLGNVGGTKEDIEGVLHWMSTGDLLPAVERTDFAGIPGGIKRLADGEVRGRLVALY